MTTSARARATATERLLALLAVLVLSGALATLAGLDARELGARWAAAAAAEDLLAGIESRPRPVSGLVVVGPVEPTGPSPFLEGETVTVAAASLQRRVATAVEASGGVLRSARPELESSAETTGTIALAAEFEIDQPGLRNLLYEIEAGLPVLFVEQLTAGGTDAAGARLRVALTVSGRWEGRP